MRKISIRKISLWIAGVSVFAGIVGLVFAAYNIRAANLTAGPLTVSYTGSQLFNESNLAPGDVIVKDISVKNNGTLPHSFSISTSGVSGNLATVLQIEPREGGVAIWNQTLSQLASLPNGTKIIVPSIYAGATKNLQIAAILPTSVGNEMQGQAAVNFNFNFGTESTDAPEPGGFTSSASNILGQNIIGAITYNPPEGGSDENPSGEVSGAETVKGASTTAKELCFWWAVVLIILIIALYLYHRYMKNSGKLSIWWLWPVVIAVILYLAHYYLDNDYQQTIFCYWLWAGEIIVLMVYYIIETRTIEE